jgi:Fic family protein
MAGDAAPLTESEGRNLHRLVMQRSRPEIAGRYAALRRYVRKETGRHEFPPPVEVPARMGDFAAWLRAVTDTPDAAFTAHRRLVEIHPFDDGSGRTGRLLINLILIRGGYPPVTVRPEDRLSYIRALRAAQVGEGTGAFELLLYERLDAVMEDYLRVLGGEAG